MMKDKKILDFRGNGSTTVGIEIAFKQLCKDLEDLGNMDTSFWALHLKGNKTMLKSRAKQIVMRAKILQELINSYTG